MIDIEPFVTAIYAITHYPKKLIRQTIEMEELNIIPLPLMHGTMQYDVWMMYRVLREYERIAHEPTKTGST